MNQSVCCVEAPPQEIGELKGGLKGLEGRKSEKDGQARFIIAIGGSTLGRVQEKIRPETQQSTEVEDILSVRKCWRMDYRLQP